MPPKLNLLGRRLFLEFSAKKYRLKRRNHRSLFRFAKYPLLSRSFLHSSKYPQPVFRLITIIGDSDLVEVLFCDANDQIDPCDTYCDLHFKITCAHFRQILLLFNTPTVEVHQHYWTHDFALDSILNIFNDYKGHLYLNFYAGHGDYRIPMINKWNSKIVSLLCPTKTLLHKKILPLKLDYCETCCTQPDELLRVLHRHKIERLNLQSLAFGRVTYEKEEETDEEKEMDKEEEEMLPNHIGNLKYLAIRIESDHLRSLGYFLAENNFNLTKLSIKEFRYPHYGGFNAVLHEMEDIYVSLFEFKDMCRNLTQELCIQIKTSSRGRNVKFKQEWIEELRRKHELLKDVKHEVEGKVHILNTQTLDGCLKLGLTLKITL